MWGGSDRWSPGISQVFTSWSFKNYDCFPNRKKNPKFYFISRVVLQNNNPWATRLHLSTAPSPASGKVLRHRILVQVQTQVKYVLPLLNMTARKAWNKWQEHKLFSTTALKAALEQKVCHKQGSQEKSLHLVET